jgi:phosphohistidine phosphatase
MLVLATGKEGSRPDEVSMPSLIMFRHAKSDWHADYGGDDRLRPLSRRGQKAAKRMGRFLARSGQLPERAITSPAVRAEQTLLLAMEAGEWDCPVRSRPTLYSDVDALFDELRHEPDETGVLLVVGHEPTWSEAAGLLTGGSQLDLPTASMLRINFDVDRWAEIGVGTGRLAWLVTPRLLGEGNFGGSERPDPS